MNVGYKNYGTCPKVWMIVCMDSNGSPMKKQQKKGCFFLFQNMHAGKNQKQGSPPRFAEGPEAIQEAKCDATRLAKTTWLLFFSVHMHMNGGYAVERGNRRITLPAVLGSNPYRIVLSTSARRISKTGVSSVLSPLGDQKGY